MTKQELVQLMGNEDRAEYAMLQVLKMVKKDFVIAALKANMNEAERVYKGKKESGYYTEFDKFPEDFNLLHEELNNPESPLIEQYNNYESRHLEEASDEATMIAAGNMYTHSLWGK